MGLQEQLGSQDQALLLAMIDRTGPATEGGARTVAHFHEHHGPGMFHHPVQLATAETHVTVQQPQARGTEQLFGGHLDRRATLGALSWHLRSASAGRR